MKKIFTILVALVLCGLMTNAQVNLQDGLVAHYPFNGNANDESGNGNNGTVNGATLTADNLEMQIVRIVLMELMTLLK